MLTRYRVCEVMDSVILGLHISHNILHVNYYLAMESEMLFSCLNSIPAFKKLSYQSRAKTLPPQCLSSSFCVIAENHCLYVSNIMIMTWL